MTDWKDFEARVRLIASFIYGKPCLPEVIDGVRFDGVIRLEANRIVLIEITVHHELDKVRTDIAKFSSTRMGFFSKNIFCECFMVKHTEPTESMVATGKANYVEVLSLFSFERRFFDTDAYRYQRLNTPFGSALDPESGQPIRDPFVSVGYLDQGSGTDVHVSRIVEILRDGARVLLYGEYGTGKSRCIQEIFQDMSRANDDDRYPYPIAINLREMWGMRSASEMIRRHFSDLGIPNTADFVIRALPHGAFCFLLDGFDELGAQTWSEDPKRIRAIRRTTVECIRDLLKKTPGPVLIAGRSHYFNSDEETFESLGLAPQTTTILTSHEEFQPYQMADYIRRLSMDVEMPTWLPRRPLVAQILSSLKKEELDDLLAAESGESDFWRKFILMLCSRESLIRAGLEPGAVRRVLRALAEFTRSASNDRGPITLAQISDIFEAEVGLSPVDESALILHRLPGLGRVQGDSNDRQFVDRYVLDGLRAEAAHRSVGDRDHGDRTSTQTWTNPLQEFGLRLLGDLIRTDGQQDKAIKYARMCAARRNATLAVDIAAALLVTPEGDDESIDFGGLRISDGYAAHIDLSMCSFSGPLTLHSMMITTLIMPNGPKDNIHVSQCVIGKIVGVTSARGLPTWCVDTSSDSYDAVATNSQVRSAGLSASQTILITIIRKTFFQRGAARKENALLRGLGQIDPGGLTNQVLRLLINEGVVDRVIGKDGPCYAPVRKYTRRMAVMLAELRLSADPIWTRATMIV